MQNYPIIISDLFKLTSNSLYCFYNMGWKNYFIFRKRGENSSLDPWRQIFWRKCTRLKKACKTNHLKCTRLKDRISNQDNVPCKSIARYLSSRIYCSSAILEPPAAWDILGAQWGILMMIAIIIKVIEEFCFSGILLTSHFTQYKVHLLKLHI